MADPLEDVDDDNNSDSQISDADLEMEDTVSEPDEDNLVDSMLLQEEGLAFMRLPTHRNLDPPIADVVAEVVEGPVTPHAVEEAEIGAVPMPPPPPPLVVERPVARARGAPLGLRQAALDCMDFEMGRIAWYATKSAFEARCNNPAHNIGGVCKLTRSNSARKRARDGQPLGGRPLGFMLAWLKSSVHFPDKQSHWVKSEWERLLTQEVRSACRTELQDSLDGQALLSHERALHAGEPEEPLSLDGLLA